MNHPTFGRTDTVPSSVAAVLEALSTKAPMTGKELREYTGLPRRTTYTALRRLREQGLLQEKASLRDTRQTYYWLSPGVQLPVTASALNGLHAPAPMPSQPQHGGMSSDRGMVPA